MFVIKRTTGMQVDITVILSTSLRLEDKGLLIVMLHADEYDTLDDIILRSANSRDSVRAALGRLMAAGYVKRSLLRENGRMNRTVYTVADSPIFKVG